MTDPILLVGSAFFSLFAVFLYFAVISLVTLEKRPADIAASFAVISMILGVGLLIMINSP